MNFHHAVITGASRGIGLCLGQKLALRGTIVSNLSRNGGLVGVHFPCDMTDHPVDGLLAAINSNGAPDLLVLNAGIAEPGLLADLSPASFRNQMEVNFFAATDITRAAVPLMKPHSRVVFIASGAAYIGIEGHSAYCASKFALRGFAEAMRAELKPRGIEVSIAYPPNTDTDMLTREMKQLNKRTKAVTMMAKTHPPEDVADKILRGIDKGRFEIPVGLELKLLGRFHSLFKPAIMYAMDRIAHKS